MYSNQHAARLVALIQKANSIDLDIKKHNLDIQWYGAFDCEQANSHLADHKRTTLAIEQRLSQLTETVEKTNQMKLAGQAIAGGWLSSLWRSPEQKVAHHQVQEMKKRLALLERSSSEARAELQAHKPRQQRLEADLRRYREFDALRGRATVAGLSEERLQLQQQIEQVRTASEKWEAMAGEVSRQWQRQQRTLEQIDNDIAKAQGFEQALSRAASKRDKAMIHQECERYFDSGRPSAVLTGLNTKRRKAERDVEKTQERLRDIVRLLDRQIETLILDGNNLCYLPTENGKARFIGLDALKALVAHLCQSYKVTLIFDPGICARLSVQSAELQAQFPEARVTVMPKATKADEGILAAAEFDQGAYIISNDRFADYQEQPAVREGRVLSHIIHPHSVQVQQLQVNVPY